MDDRFAGLQRQLDDAVTAGAPGVVAAVMVDGRTVFEGAAGLRRVGAPDPMTVDTVLAIFSMTKAVTSAAAMQLVERGLLRLDRPAAEVLPELGALRVLEGFADDGTPRLRAPARPVTLRHLLTHTSGFVYDIWNAGMARWISGTGTPSLFSLRRDALRLPLAFDPGDRWDYGIGIDWAGLMVEEIAGTTLGRWCGEHLFGPLGMSDTSFAPGPDQRGRQATMHVATPNGPVPAPMAPPEAPEFEMGGGGLVSTVRDYLRFAEMVRRGGELDGVRVMEAATAAAMGTNAIGDVLVRPLVSVNPRLSQDCDLHPGVPCRWGLGFLVNETGTAEGRAAGSMSWAGLANTFQWIDPTNGVSAVWGTQLLPFMEPRTVAALRRFERAVYDALAR